MRRCEAFFSQWAKGRFDALGKKILNLRKERQKMMGFVDGNLNTQAILDISKEIEQAVEMEANHWKQRARINWLSNGDRNTRAFHMQASKRRKKDTIKKLKDEAGCWKEEEEDKAHLIQDCFRELFTSSNPSHAQVDRVVGSVDSELSQEDILFLERPYGGEEVRKAIFDMHPTKSPGPDGFNARFFQRFWLLVGDFVTKKVLDVLNGNADIEDWNETLIGLIPKKETPEVVANFRPISLCNTCYKLVSKVIVNRLHHVLGRVIDQTQSAFIKARLITDNILISYECQHWLRRRKAGKDGYAALKIDISKAYDRVEWNYLEAMMIKMGFPEKLIILVMRCVRSVKFSFLLNRSVFGIVRPERGLRQRDPLSPFLFVICAQGLSSLLFDKERRGKITRVPIAPQQFNITHLFFADDSLLFIKARKTEAEAVKDVLQLYEEAFGQLINLGKSSLSFSLNTNMRDIEEVKTELGIAGESGIQMYLGLPTYSLRQKRLQFGFIRDRVQKKLMSWNQREFSAGGKVEVLMKAVIQAIPTYSMQCFRIPESICSDIDRLCAGFWWGDKEAGRKLH